jgi:hypothetical protein
VFDLDFTVDDLKKIDFEKLFLVLVLKKKIKKYLFGKNNLIYIFICKIKKKIGLLDIYIKKKTCYFNFNKIKILNVIIYTF